MIRIFLTISLAIVFFTAPAQQVLMQGWYWDYPKTNAGKSWADTLRLKAAQMKTSGFTHIWFPPHAVASSGPGSNGFDPKDLFIGNQTTGLGTRAALNSMLAEFSTQNIAPVPDLTYNHRDGGKPEINPPVKDYITNYYTATKSPFPSDRFRCILPLGGASGNGAGDYYFKIASKTGDIRFNNYGYRFYMQTNTIGNQALPDLMEVEPNGGGDCGQPNNAITLGRNLTAIVETTGGCNTDEFHLLLNPGDFNPAGDTLFIYLVNNGVPVAGYSDHRIYGIYSAPRGTDIINDLGYQTYTDFSGLPSGRGQMNFDYFKPNNANAATTSLNGNWDTLYFYYDYDQLQQKTADTLIEWTKWNWDELGARGIRLDAVKHYPPSFVGKLLDSMHIHGKNPSMVVGEWYSANPTELSNWVNDVKANMSAAAQAAIKPKVFDFALREQLRQSCDNAGYDCRNVFANSLHDATGLSGFHIMTFVNNHDFRDMSGFNSLVRNNTDLAYAYTLTNNQLGVPEVFYPDYYGYPAPSGGLYAYHPTNLPAYRTGIDQLIYILKNFINGSPSVDYLNRFGTPYTSSFISGTSSRSLIYQLQGFAGNNNRDLIVAINFDNTTLRVDHQINNRGGAIITGTRFNDITGTSAFPYQVLNASGQVYIELPPKTYAVWIQNNGPVAVNLLSFNGVLNGEKVNLEWKTANEEDISNYIVERSVNNIDFSPIGAVNALNTPAVIITYKYTDDKLPVATDIYYRLRIVSRDGTIRYSDIVRIKRNAIPYDAFLFPNPTKGGRATLTMNSPLSKKINLIVYDQTGRKVFHQSLNLISRSNSFPLELGFLAPGAYTLVVEDGEKRIRKPFVNQ